MKTNQIMPLTTGLGLALIIVGLAGVPTVTRANDGIAASPKVQAQLAERTRPAAPATIQVSMTCPDCKDAFIPVRETDPKALGAKMLTAGASANKLVAKHLCRGCSTTITATGTGKAKHDVVTHTCVAPAG